MSPKASLTAALSPLLASSDPELQAIAIARLSPFLKAHAGNLTHVSAATGIELRTLWRWAAKCPAFRAAVDQAKPAQP